MKYIVCEICGGYYRLLEGESLDDFDSCQCGGKFYQLEMDEESADLKIETSENKNLEFDNLIYETVEVDNEFSEVICKECGNQNNINTAFCTSCGQILVNARDLSGTDNSSTMKPKLSLVVGFTFIALFLVLLGFLF
ncbi:MAG: hypothetical protein HVN35_06790 [Methanobacteriaceae archaeon]|nr:hypothetical protein [Methanobacteriaceae archaeon]